MSNAPGNLHVTRWNSKQGPVDGRWGVPTASIDWCEWNYEVSYYLAEFANTLSNLAFVALALYGIRQSLAQKLPFPLILCHLGVAIVGLGSFWFHATLSYEAQLADELPMIIFSSFITYVAFDTKPQRSSFVNLLPYLLVAYDVAVSVIYVRYLRSPVFHQTAYAFIQLVTTTRCLYVIRTKLRDNSAARLRRRTVILIETIGSTSFLTGFAIWNIDNLFCDTLTQWKAKVGFPTSLLLEGHAWWHLGTGIGAYFIVVGIQMLSLCLKEGYEGFEVKWGLAGTTPYVARIPPSRRKGKKAE